jgi:hypothetical protein
MNWRAFQQAAPTLAHLAAQRFAEHGVALLGTLRKDGSPRISPVEPLLTEDDLLLGLMWRSTKAMDLLHDARCTLHSAITSLEGTEGECKLDGRAMEAADPALRAERERLFRARWGDESPVRFHVFAFDIERAAFIVYAPEKGEMRVMRWNPRDGLRERQRPYP